MDALWDTNAVSYWFLGVAEFKRSIGNARMELDAKGARHFISAITIHEFGYFLLKPENAHRWPAFQKFITESFQPSLAFDGAVALIAANFEVAHGRVKMGGDQSKKDLWCHDCAIAATATHHTMDVVVTAESRWLAYAASIKKMGCATTIRVVDEDPAARPPTKPAPVKPPLKKGP